MPPKGGGKKKGVIIDGIDTTPMTREQLQTFALKLKEENDREREQRNFFQLERDKLRTFWEITRNELEEARAKLRNKDRQIEEEREKNAAELQFYKQKVKHFQYEHQLDLTESNASQMVSLQKAQEDHKQAEEELCQDKRNLKQFTKDQEFAHQEQIKALNLKHSEDIYNAREQFNERVKEIELKYEKKFHTLKKELDTKHKMEMSEVEERKGTQVSELRKHHDKSYTEMKNYYNDITLNNLALISALKGQMETLRKQNERMTKQTADLTAENQKLAGPLKVAMEERKELLRKLQNYNKDKISLANTANKLREANTELKELQWTNEALEIRFENISAEKEELEKRFIKAVLEVNQKTSLKNELLSKRVELLHNNAETNQVLIEKLNLQVSDADKRSNRKLEEILNTKNDIIRDLQYEVARVSKAHDDMLETYEEKLVQFGIPKSEVGFAPLQFIPPGQAGLARGPAGLVANTSK